MTVAQLIEQLQQLPQTLPVVLNCGKNELANGEPVGTVAVVTAGSAWSDGPYFLTDRDSEEWDFTATVVNLTP